MQELLENQAPAQLSTLVREKMSEPESSFDNSVRAINTRADLLFMEDVLPGDESGELQLELTRLRGHYPVFEQHVVADERGIVVATTLASSMGRDIR